MASRLYNFTLLFACGLRPGGEALGLRRTDYDGTNPNVHHQIVRRKSKSTTKTHELRVVFVPTWARPVLERHLATCTGTYIFTNKFGEHHKDTDAFNAARRVDAG